MTDSFDPITVVHDCTNAEYAEALEILSGKKRLTRVGWFGLLLFVILVIALFLLLKSQSPSIGSTAKADTPSLPSDIVIAMWLVGIGIALCVLCYLLLKRTISMKRRQWKGQFKFTIADDGITQSRPGRSDRWTWKRFAGLNETPNVFILRIVLRNGIILPKRLFVDENQIARLRELLQSKLARPVMPISTGFPVNPI